MATEFPVSYLNALDELYAQESFANAFAVADAQFVTAKTVKVPTMNFGTANPGSRAYNRFANEDVVELKYETYELDSDREKTFYVDAVESQNEANLRIANALGEWTRTQYVPELDAYFFGKAAAAAKTKATAAISKTTIKDELRKARTQMKQAGIARANLYMTSAALSALEDAIDRQFAGEGNINDMVGSYNIFDVYEVDDTRLAGNDFIVIGGGQNTIKLVNARAANYMFAPGQHTKGDGYLMQNRWVYGTVALKNKQAGIYVNKAASSAS